MRLLFITRKHPPSIGGMQRLSYHLVTQMRQRARVSAITWGGSQKFLPFFLSYALARSTIIGRRGIDLVHVGDPVVAPIGWIMRKLFRVPVVVTVHGLDITLSLGLYQWFIPKLLQALDRIVCISGSTLHACTERGIPARKCVIIHPGVDVPSAVPSRERAHRRLGQVLKRDLEGVTVLLTVGRLVPRKGVSWFVECVLPKVLAAKAEVCYVIVGSGPNEGRIRSMATRPDVSGSVYVLGRVSDDDLAHIYTAADLFVMPNLPMPGDMEGFGLVALEAAAHGLPVLAADLEGIRDAVVPERTGRLLQPGKADSWAEGLLAFLNDPESLQEMAQLAPVTVKDRFTWAHMADAYEDLFRRVIREQH